MANDDKGTVWGTVMLAGVQVIEWKIEGGNKKLAGTELRGFFKAMAEQAEGREAVLRVSFLVKC